MRVALYARVSSDAQEAKGTIGSQLEVLRARVAAENQELVAEYLDDGYSGARLDRPGLDALRDAAEAGLIEAVWCLSPDRLARAYAYQVVILDELERFGVRVLFVDTPPLDDPQARLLTQVQGVIAEYERAKIAERNRRGKLYRSRAGEIVSWKAPYGYRVVPRSPESPARLEIYEPEAAVVRRILDDYITIGRSIRQITLALNIDGVPTATGKSEWAPAVVGRFLRNEAYVGRAYYNRTMWTTTQSGRRSQQRQVRPKEEWIPIAVPPTIAEDVFEAAQRVSRDNTKFSPRRLTDEAWLLRGLVICGSCGVHANSQRLRGTHRGNDKSIRYYFCPNHDRLRAGGEARRCPERHIRADEFDAFVFDQVRSALLQPDVLVTGQAALANKGPVPDDELLAVELARLDRKIESADTERRRLADLYQAGLLELPEVQRRSRDVAARRQALATQHDHLVAQRNELVTHNRLRNRVDDFANRISKGIDKLDFNHRQQLMRLVVDHVTVTGWQVEIHLRIPLDGHTTASGRRTRRQRKPTPKSKVSSDDGLRLLRAGHHHRVVGPLAVGQLGVATGARSGLIVIDVDPAHQGNESLDHLQSLMGSLPSTAQTGGGGGHLFFTHPGIEVRNTAGRRSSPPKRSSSSQALAGADLRARSQLDERLLKIARSSEDRERLLDELRHLARTSAPVTPLAGTLIATVG